MAKDPAFLFYSGDFLTGVTGMTMEERGQYITLLCLQHAKGRLTIDLINRSVPGLSSYVLEKFKQDEDGLYFNQRLEEEAIKRNKFCESRSKNRTAKDKDEKHMINICETSVLHMENENVNSNDIVLSSNVNNKGVAKIEKNTPTKRTKKQKTYLDDASFDQLMQIQGKEQVKIGFGLVYLRRSDYDKFIEEFGREMTHEMITQLDLYKSDNIYFSGKQLYVRDESVMRKSWVLKNAKDALQAKNSNIVHELKKTEKAQDKIKKLWLDQ